MMNVTEPTNRYGVEVSLSTFVSHSLPSMCFWVSCDGRLAISEESTGMYLGPERTSEKASISEIPGVLPANAADGKRVRTRYDLRRK